MSAENLATGLVSGAIDVGKFHATGEALNAASRAINQSVDYSVGMGAWVFVAVSFGLIILGLLAIIRWQNHRADQREKDQAKRSEAREKEWAERHRMDADRQERDIMSRENLAKSVQELSILTRVFADNLTDLKRSFKCHATTDQPSPPPKLLPKPEGI